ncbi:MAG: hypothetical protein Q9202_004329 [Teloschistes flavicans]
MVSTLRKVLPKPIYRTLRNFVNPPKASLRSLKYHDTFIILQVHRNKNGQLGPTDALEWLQQACHHFHTTSPQILRCEMHHYTYPNMDIKVHINIRFDSWHSAETFTFQGVSLYHWLMEVETTTSCWTCELYQQGIGLLAGFDRGGSGRNVMVAAEDALVKPSGRNSSSADRRSKSLKTKERAEASPSADSPKAQEESVDSGSIPLRKCNPRLDAIAEEQEEIELEEMSEVRRGKQRER